MKLSFKYATHILLFGLIYYAVSMASLWLGHLYGATPFLPAAGVAAALIYLGGYRYWPAIFIGVTAVSLSWSTPFPIFITNTIVQIGGAFILVYALRQFNHFSGNFSRIKDVADMFVAAIPAVLFSGLVWLLNFFISGTPIDTQAALLLLILVLGNLTGIITIMPLILVWKRPCSCLQSRQLMAEAAIITLASITIFILALNTSSNSPLWYTPYIYMVLPFAIWGTLRFHTHGATAFGVFVAILVMVINVQSYTTGVLPFNGILIKMVIAILNMAAALIVAAVLTEWEKTHTTLLKIQKQLQEQLSFSQTIMDALGQAVFVVDLNEQLEYVNPAYANIIGYDDDALIGQSPKKFIPEPHKYKYDRAVTQRVDGVTSSYESELQHKDGSTIPVLITGAPRWENGRVTGAVVINTDLTERNRAQEMIQIIVSKSPNTTLVIDQKSKIVFANALVKQTFGYTPDKLIGQPLSQLIPDRFKTTHHKQETAYHQKPLTRNLGTGRVLLAQHADGHEFSVEIALSPIEMKGESMVMATLVDVTARMEMAQKLQQREAYLRILVEQAPIGIIVANMDGIITNANPYSVKLLGSPSQEKTIGLNLLTLPPLVKSGLSDAFHTVITGGEMVEKETWYTSIWNRHVYFFLRIVPHRNENDEQIGILILIEDMTARVQAEEAMLQLQKTESLGILAGGIAHDFNNLLVAIMAQSSLALMKMDEDAAARSNVEKSNNAAKRAAELTNQLLAYSGRGRFHINHLNMNGLIEENRELFTASIPKHIELSQSLAPDLPLIEADVSQIQQVVMNLIINASEAMGEKPGYIHLATRIKTVGINDSQYGEYVTGLVAGGNYVQLTVQDNGSGMDSETMKMIFDPFFSTKETGHGLGLAAVLGIVKGHHGALSVRSSKNGTVFDLLFPVLATDSPAPSGIVVKTAVSTTTEPLTGMVLIIDDEAPVCMAVTDILGLEGIEAVSAHNGRDGVALYQRKLDDISLIILDLSMPGWDGQRTLEALRAINPNVCIILSSGYSEDEAMQRFDEEIPSAFLSKPYNVDGLLDVIKQNWPSATDE